MSVARERHRDGRRHTIWALLFSLLFHGVIILTVASIYIFERTPPPPEPDDIEIVFIEPPSPPAPPRFVDVPLPADEAPEQAVFESDVASLAASPEAAEGDLPLPTQEGREQPTLELQDQELVMAQMQETQPVTEQMPVEEDQAEPQEVEETPAEPAEQEDPVEPEPDALLAMADPVARQTPTPTPRPAAPAAPPPSQAAYRPQTRATRLRGSVDSRGRSAVDSVATPLGRYRKAISDAVGSSWYYYIGPRLDMFSYGTLTVIFTIDKDGRVRSPRVLSNSSNESFEIVTLESILAAEIPPIPPEVLPTLEGGRIEVDYSFSIITN